MIARLPKGATKGMVMLHGRGGSAADILSLLDHAGLPQVAAVAPEAAGSSWWPSSFLAPAAQMEPFVQQGLAQVAQGISALEQAGIPRAAIWLCGFSQGACLALEAFARQGEGLAGVFALSGGLVGTDDLPGSDAALYGHADKRLTYSARLTGQAWISVHARDPHIPLKRAEDSAAVLRAMGAAVQLQVYPGAGHAVMREDIAALRQALNL
ncbi:alpha/beta hydrolase [Pseudotabrizicola algicola]|uniref:Phospholipase n=1 Tax=Pseudotabrizicola algicola TaxID=2709381 RepID=A0A6B3RLI3_9RHOB|nr:dienelactone hydrolase family protein [Pseudotabrizicola algicola]NEX45718.1 phospholipase [Pseudotabrizicola algicola]